MNVSLRQLRAFLAVARVGSFSRAADSLHLTQSALSGLIKELESALDLRVFDRSTRRIQLSDVGRELRPIVEKVIQDLDTALDEVASLKALKKGMLRIAAPQLISCTLLPEVIAAYRSAHPQIRIRLFDCVVEGVQARVFSGEADFGIGPERDPTLEISARTLFEMPFMAVFPPGHPLERLERIRWADAVQYPIVALQGQFTERLSVDLHAALPELTLNPSNEVTFMTTALSMVGAGLGIAACLPYARSLAHSYRLQMRPLHEPEVTRKFFVFTRNGRSLSPAAESFIDFLFRFVEQHEWSAPVSE
ncbi:MAG: LysR family transcriptional regulator [Betaproteobacteria bacterium CG2_30_68_42]|nr:MAG: LysR family transcriptional regulator [Betaproteobacteria bacterium CG2_30_68_42]